MSLRAGEREAEAAALNNLALARLARGSPGLAIGYASDRSVTSATAAGVLGAYARRDTTNLTARSGGSMTMFRNRRSLRTIIVALACFTAFATADRVLIFGGTDHDDFLGCLSCSEYDSDSVFNEYGTYGSRYASDSIFNDYGTYGSEFSRFSPCNEFATDPPILVGDDGSFYGYLTLNRFHSQAVTLDEIVTWLRTSVCGDN